MLNPPAADSSPEPAPALSLPRVLLLGWEYAPRLTGGLGTASVRLAHALAERVELSVIVPRLPEYETADDVEPPLSKLAADADGPDLLRHFPESADWTDDDPRPPAAPGADPVSRVLSESSPNLPAAAGGQLVRITALNQLTPAAVHGPTTARPPRYEGFARHVHRVSLAVLPYAEPLAREPAEEAAKSTEELPPATVKLALPATRLVNRDAGEAGLAAKRANQANPAEASAPPPETPAPTAETAVESSMDEPTDFAESSANVVPDSGPLAEALASFQVRAPAINPLVLPSSNTEVVQFARLAAHVAVGETVDVVYAHDWPTFLAGVEIRLEKRVPLVLHVHSTSYDRHGPPVQGWVFELERAAFRAADRVVAVSHYGAAVLTEHYGVATDRLRVVHHGLSAGPLGPQWEARPVSATPAVLFVGRLTSQKNPLGFVEIARLVAAQVPGARFAVAGDGPQRDAVQAAAEAAGLTDEKFELLGFLDDEAVTAALTAAAVVCLPARSEPFGLAALEAAAAGVPLVLSTTTGAAEVLPGARTAPFDDAEALAAHVVELLRDESARRHAVRENAAAARRLTWERAAEEVLAVLTEAVAPRPSTQRPLPRPFPKGERIGG